MSWLSEMIRDYIAQIKANRKSGKPTPVPVPVPLNVPPDDWRARGQIAINRYRASKGVGALYLDANLCGGAEAQVAVLAAGAKPHNGFPDCVRTRGWPYVDRHIRNAGFGNVTEGDSEGGRTPEECVAILWSNKDPDEPHRRDVEDPNLNWVGLAFAPTTSGPFLPYGGYSCVVVYGSA